LKEIHEVAASFSPTRRVIAEDDRNEPALVTEMGLDGIWADDFHHQVHVLLTGERDGYYAAYEPDVGQLAHTLCRGWSYEGQVYPPSGKPRGKPADPLAFEQLVYCIQNHDQIGNRAMGTRLDQEAGVSALCAATMLLLFLPNTPLLFMGQEWAAPEPFLFFSDLGPDLGPRVSEGRRREFARFPEFTDAATRERIPDPQAESTFTRSRLDWSRPATAGHDDWLRFHRALLARRAEAIAPLLANEAAPHASWKGRGDTALEVVWRFPAGTLRLAANLGGAAVPHEGPGTDWGDRLYALNLPSPTWCTLPAWSVAFYLARERR
jgi:maltooligosyltrehalose trehalohydrolase